MYWQHKDISHLLEQPAVVTEQLLSKHSAWGVRHLPSGDENAGKQTTLGVQTGDKGKAGHA